MYVSLHTHPSTDTSHEQPGCLAVLSSLLLCSNEAVTVNRNGVYTLLERPERKQRNSKHCLLREKQARQKAGNVRQVRRARECQRLNTQTHTNTRYTNRAHTQARPHKHTRFWCFAGKKNTPRDVNIFPNVITATHTPWQYQFASALNMQLWCVITYSMYLRASWTEPLVAPGGSLYFIPSVGGQCRSYCLWLVLYPLKRCLIQGHVWKISHRRLIGRSLN